MTERAPASGSAAMILDVNGEERSVTVDARRSLLESLRSDLSLTGTKEGCGMGTCGTCTVIVDDRAVLSCLVLAVECAGATVETIEHLAAGPLMSPLQQAFVSNDALQCGFCTPGQIMSLEALRRASPSPTTAEIETAIQGNLCRCGAYRHILDAAEAALCRHDGRAGPERAGPEQGRPERAAAKKAVDLADDEAGAMGLGRAEPRRIEASQKVTGRARYVADVVLPDLLVAAIVRSPHAHGRVLAVDTEDCLGVEGVIDVLTADDVADVRWYDEDVPLLGDTVRFVGDEVAVVVARTREAAEDGAAAVRVRYDVREAVTDLDRALEPGAPLVHPDGNRSAPPDTRERGDVDHAMAGAAVVVDRTYRTQIAVHNALETHGTTAWWDADQLTLYTSTQAVNDVREDMADRLGLPHNAVRVVAEHVGGGFGAKQVPWKSTMFAALASRRTGHPVRVDAGRRAENLAHGKRNATRQRVRLAAAADGRLLAIDADLVADTGAYGVSGEASNLAGLYLHLYACPNVRTVSHRVRTTTGPAVAFRAPGYVEAAFALESAMDELARRLGLDPIELRRRNYTTEDQERDVPWSSPQALERCYDAVVAASQWGNEPAPTGSLRSGVRRGRGFAAHEWMAGQAQPPGYAWLELNADGSVHVSSATQDIGTGTRTVLAQTAADVLGVDVDRVRVTLGDTAAGPVAPTSAGSTTTPTVVPAVHAAATEARRRLLAAAALRLGWPEDELSIVDGAVVAGTGGVDGLAVGELLAGLEPERIHGYGARLDTPDDVSVRTFGCAVADVEVDEATGVVSVVRLVIAPDCGRILNRALVDSQVIGGATQGIGFALIEEQLIDHDLGRVVNDTLDGYLVPTVSDTCPVVHAVVDLPDLAANALGVKGVGELPLIPVPAAIANAVHDALGIRFAELPLTPRRVLEALAAEPGHDGDDLPPRKDDDR